MKKPLPSRNTLLQIVSGCSVDDTEYLVENEEMPDFSEDPGQTAENSKKQADGDREGELSITDISVTIVNPLHAHMLEKEEEPSSSGSTERPPANMLKLRNIRKSIETAAESLGAKFHITKPATTPEGVRQITADVGTAELSGETYSIDDAISHIGIGRYQIAWFILLGMSSMSQASEIALASVILSNLICEWDISIVKASLIPALVLLAALPGGYLGGVIADKRGRKTVIIAGQWLILIFGVLSAFMRSFHTFVLIRMFVGFGFGIVTSLVIVHVSEIAPPKYRAYSVAINVFMWSIGDCFIVLMGYYSLSTGWPVVVLAACVPALVMCVVILFLDESPRYLCIADNVHEAERILSKIATINYTDLPPGRLVAVPEPDRGNILEMFGPRFKRTTLLLLFSVFTANLVYYGNIFSLPYLFRDEYCSANSTALNTTFIDRDCTFSRRELMATLEVSAAEFLSIPIFAVLVEKLGRIKTGMLLGVSTAVLTAACVPCLGLVLFKAELFSQRMVVNAWLLLLFIYSPELYPTYIRSAAFGLVMVFCNLGGAFAALIVYDVGLDYSFRAMFLFLSPFALAGAIAAFHFKEETKGKTLVDNKIQVGGDVEKKCCDRQQTAAY